MEKMVKFFKSKMWDKIYFIFGFAITIISAIYALKINSRPLVVFLTFIQTIICLTLVNCFANKKGKLGCTLGVPESILGTFNYYMNGSIGDMLIACYSIFIYLRGLFFNKISNKMNVQVGKKKNLIVTIFVCILGAAIIFFFGDKIMYKYVGAPFWITAINIIIFLIAAVCQYLSIEGIFLAWPLRIFQSACSITLYIWLIITQGETGNIIYLALHLLFLLNNFKAIVIWADDLKKTNSTSDV